MNAIVMNFGSLLDSVDHVTPILQAVIPMKHNHTTHDIRQHGCYIYYYRIGLKVLFLGSHTSFHLCLDC